MTTSATTGNALTVSVPAGTPFIDVRREFDASVSALFEAHRDPEKIKQWLGPDGFEMKIELYDFTTGGRYRYVHTCDGEEYRFNGVFHTVRENELAVQTFEYEGFGDVVAIETLTFDSLTEDRSRLTIHSTYPSVESRDGMVQSGMEGGLSQGYIKLDALLRDGGVGAPSQDED
ncbi:MAG: SRPBCC family protein [Humibacillus sp.]|nr:SRPBCC family protein [Humibacillus sp.]MDN5778737.1 SRPBCC family protein [Humibacillus sp.]